MQSEALYILGDLFEAWLGDDDDDAHNRRVTAALCEAGAGGLPIYIMHGNRDFLMGPLFERHSGCRLIADPVLITLYGEPTLLMHGDTLCTQDSEYQAVRLQVRNPVWQQAFLALPLSERRTLAQQYRAESRAKTRNKPEFIMDVDQTTVERVMREHGVRRLIHGHTHRPALHDFMLDSREARRIVLGDWYEQGSALRCDSEGCKLSALHS